MIRDYIYYITTPSECSAIWVLLLQWRSSKWHLLRKKSAKSSILLAAKILFYFIVRLTGCGSPYLQQGSSFLCLLLREQSIRM